MLRDNLVGYSHRCLENPRPTRAEPSLTEDVISPFQAEPRHVYGSILRRHSPTLRSRMILGHGVIHPSNPIALADTLSVQQCPFIPMLS
jgi:hypothetical protein